MKILAPSLPVGKKRNRGPTRAAKPTKWLGHRQIHKCVAQVSPADFAFSHYDRSFSRCVLREEREGKRGTNLTMQLVRKIRISNKILMLTMFRRTQQPGTPVGGVPPPWSRVLDHDMSIEESNQLSDASVKVPRKLNNFLRTELETHFDPSLHSMVGELRMGILLEIVRKPPMPVGCLSEEEVVARLVEVFGLSSIPLPVAVEDVLRKVVQKCVVAFQMLEAEAVVLERII